MAEHVECKAYETNAEYHADLTHVGSSMLKTSGKSLRLYYELYVAQTRPKPPPTPDQVLGSLTHTCLFEPNRLNDDYVLAPHECKARRGGKWEDTAAEAAETGKTPILESWLCLARDMAEAVKASPMAAKLLQAEGVIERSIRWEDSATGIRLKCRPDKLVIDPSLTEWPLRVDFKTAEDPRPATPFDDDDWGPYPRAAWKWQYHCQDALYLAGCATVCEEEPRSIHIVAGKEYPHDVYVYQQPYDLIRRGRQINNYRLQRLAVALADGQWVAPEQTELQTTEAPPWAKRQ